MTEKKSSKNENLKTTAPESDPKAPNDPTPAAKPEKQPDLTAPEKENKLLKDQLAELTNDLQRTRADFENFRKNLDKEKTQIKRFACFATVEKFLPLIDDFERALATYPELAPLEKNFNKTLASLGLERIKSDEKTEFNPAFHEAVMTEGEGEKEKIAQTLRSGYLYEGEVLRPALVKVRLS